MKKTGAQLKLVMSRNETPQRIIENSWAPLSTIDLFCGAGGITEGFREAGYKCLYANDCMPEAIETFLFNHPEAWAEAEDIENVDPAAGAEAAAFEERRIGCAGRRAAVPGLLDQRSRAVPERQAQQAF